MTDIFTITDQQQVLHCLLFDITLGNVTYYMSSAYAPLNFGGNSYTELGAFIEVDDVRSDLKATNGDIAITLSGIPSNNSYMDIVLSTNYELLTNYVFERYRGIITNYTVDETENFLNGELSNRITVACASLHTLLEQKVPGQRTNGSDRRQFYPGDISFDRVSDLQNTNFDFGKEYRGGTGAGGYAGGGGGGGAFGGGGPGGNFFDDLAAFDFRNRP